MCRENRNDDSDEPEITEADAVAGNGTRYRTLLVSKSGEKISDVE